MQLTGVHHLTAVSADAPGNKAFYTGTLGMRLVKEDRQPGRRQRLPFVLRRCAGAARHRPDILRFPDPAGTAWQQQHQPHGLTRRRRADAAMVEGSAREGRGSPRRPRRARRPPDARFRGPGRPAAEPRRRRRLRRGHPWEKSSPVPAEHQIRGLGPITLTVPDLAPTGAVLTAVMNMTKVRDYAASGKRGRHRARLRNGARAGQPRSCTRRTARPAARASGLWRRAPRLRLPLLRRTKASTTPGRNVCASCAFRTAARSTATGSARSISASQTASCSRSPPTGPASPPTSRWRLLARSWPCPRSWSRAARKAKQASSRCELLGLPLKTPP